VNIIPCSKRLEKERQKLSEFHHTLQRFDELPALIEDSKLAMGLDLNGSGFPADILRIEISGPTRPHLTVVGLPNFEHLDSLQKPCLVVYASNTGRNADKQSFDKAGNLSNRFHICIGSRVMLTENIWPAAGLCNGRAPFTRLHGLRVQTGVMNLP
jgi:hypothetical protein